MNATITLHKKHLQTAARQARKLGKTTEAYIESLIEHDNRTFDEILAPMRKGFEAIPDDELDALFERANKAARQRMRSRR